LMHEKRFEIFFDFVVFPNYDVRSKSNDRR